MVRVPLSSPNTLRIAAIVVTLLLVVAFFSSCAVAAFKSAQAPANPAAIPKTSPRPSPSPSRVPSPTAVPKPVSWLNHATLVTIYGRGFGIDPVLGRLGMDRNFADLQAQIRPFEQGAAAESGGRTVIPAIHLIYAIANPCHSPTDMCVGYLDDTGIDILKQYILPAEKLGWLVILDDQLGRSNPKSEVSRMIARGYLRHDNVEVAFDPEFHATALQPEPGVPVGSLSSADINAGMQAINDALVRGPLPHRKLVLVHEFQEPMVTDRSHLKLRLGLVDPVMIADGFGAPGVKAHVYSALMGPGVRDVRLRGIKLFYPNPYESGGHGDAPLMSWPQVFGHAPAVDPSDGRPYRVTPPPKVVVIA